MTPAAQIAGVVIGIAFVVAGGSKLAAGSAWPPQAVELGAPRVVIPVVPWFELTLGALLAVQVERRVLAVVAFVTLGVFTALIVARLREGKRPACACFGAWSAKPIGAGNVVRNGVLMAVAAVAALP